MKLRTPDKGWAWISLAAAFCCNLFAIGVLRASGILFLAFRIRFGILREQAAWPLMIRKITGQFAGLFIGFLSHFITLKKLAVSGIIVSIFGLAGCYFAGSILLISILFGFLLGLGLGMLSSTNVIIVNRYFKKYRTVALGVLYSGTASGAFIYPILTSYLLEEYELQGCFLLLASVLMQSLVAVTLYKNPPLQQQETKEKPSKQQLPHGRVSEIVFSFYEIFHTIMFHVIWLTVAIASVTSTIYITVIVDYAIDSGIHQKSAVYILSSVSITEVCGRLSCGWMIDLGWMKRRTLVSLIFFIKAVIYVTIPIWSTYSGLLVTTFCMGFVTSCFNINISALYTDYLGLKNLPLGIGTGKALNGFLQISSPLIIGYFRDVRGSYQAMFFYFAGMSIFSSILWLLEPIIMKIFTKEITKL